MEKKVHEPNWDRPMMAVTPSRKAECHYCQMTGEYSPWDLSCNAFPEKPYEVIYGAEKCPCCVRTSQCLRCRKYISDMKCEKYDEIADDFWLNQNNCEDFQEPRQCDNCSQKNNCPFETPPEDIIDNSTICFFKK